jgi:hypothetical protein
MPHNASVPSAKGELKNQKREREREREERSGSA